jgi:hypothetical protein
VLLTPSGTTLRLVSDTALKTETENSYDMNNSSFRTPSIVVQATPETTPVQTDYGYELPVGWDLAGSGQAYMYNCNLPLEAGKSSFIHLDMFRPATSNTSRKDFLSVDESIDVEDLADFCLCKTDYYVTISYKQERTSNVKQNIAKRSIRRRPQMGMSSKTALEIHGEHIDTNEDDDRGTSIVYDEVSLERTGTLVWSSPISATFRAGIRIGFPSGINHPWNAIDPRHHNTNDEIVLHNGESLTTHCSLQLDPSMEGLESEIVSVRFEVSSPFH